MSIEHLKKGTVIDSSNNKEVFTETTRSTAFSAPWKRHFVFIQHLMFQGSVAIRFSFLIHTWFIVIETFSEHYKTNPSFLLKKIAFLAIQYSTVFINISTIFETRSPPGLILCGRRFLRANGLRSWSAAGDKWICMETLWICTESSK